MEEIVTGEKKNQVLGADGLRDWVRGGLHELVIEAGLQVVSDLLEQERNEWCGSRYERQDSRAAYRAGYANGEVVLSGRRVAIRRPRARTIDGKEVTLATWAQATQKDALEGRAFEQVVIGVSTRKYERSLEPILGRKTRGQKKSSVSRHFIQLSSIKLAELMTRQLETLSLCALLIDGLHVGEHMVLVALGIDDRGKKHVLGIQEGATENATATTALLANLRARGVQTDRPILVAIDGSLALHKAVKDVFGDYARIQRCQEHKKRNVTDYLPKHLQDPIRTRLNAAYNATNFGWAKHQLESLANELQQKYPSAAASIREGLDETLTVLRLRLPESLQKALCSTNLIESLISHIRRISRNVKTWQGGSMALRWTATSVLEAERGFRRVDTSENMRALTLALKADWARTQPKKTRVVDLSVSAA